MVAVLLVFVVAALFGAFGWALNQWSYDWSWNYFWYYVLCAWDRACERWWSSWD